MSDSPRESQPAELQPPADTAGSLLKQARLAKGLHIAALATSIKVAPRKLELLEADRYEELPGATFTRALAQTICRTLKIDPAPVLALLPPAVDQGLAHMSTGLNEPFRDKPGRRVPSDLSFLKNPVLVGTLVLVAASAVLYFLPDGWLGDRARMVETPVEAPRVTQVPAVPVLAEPPPEQASAPLADTPPAAASAPGAIEPAAAQASAPASMPASASAPVSSAAAAASGGALLVRASAQSWVEVTDGRGNLMLARLLDAGETVGLDGPTPLRVKIGNAAGTQVSFRGKRVDLVSASRENVAKLELR